MTIDTRYDIGDRFVDRDGVEHTVKSLMVMVSPTTRQDHRVTVFAEGGVWFECDIRPA